MDRRTGLQRHLDFDPVQKHAGDHRPFLGQLDFPFDQRSQHDDLIRRQADCLGLCLQLRRKFFGEFLRHGLQNHFFTGAAADPVRVGKQKTFGPVLHVRSVRFVKRRIDLGQSQETFLTRQAFFLKQPGDLLHGKPFGNRELRIHRNPLGHDFDNLSDVHRA